ncbi:MAG: hypothetical protein WCO06_06485 [Candidatus Roizmanbacteria bacterium]
MACQLELSMTTNNNSRLRILLIEDEFNTVRGTARAIGLRVASLDKTATIVDAIEQVKNNKYDLLIVDVRLPYQEDGEIIQESGLDFISELHSGKFGDLNKTSSFIVLTAQLKSLRLDLLQHNPLCKGVFGKLEHFDVMNKIDELQNLQKL